MTTPSPAQVESFYRAGVLGLRALEAREGRGRRLGPAADATWHAFRGEPGELDDRDRLDILLRDAAATSPLAFAPRRIFALAGLSEDEPFGHAWPGLPVGLARPLLRAAAENLAPRPAHVVLAEVASACGWSEGSSDGGRAGRRGIVDLWRFTAAVDMVIRKTIGEIETMIAGLLPSSTPEE